MKIPVLTESRNLRYFTFFYLYVMQGIPGGFRGATVYNYLIEKGLTASAVGSFVLVVGLPWSFQFVWGPIVDRFQHSLMGHRKQWVVLTQLVAVAASLGLLLVHDPLAQLGLMSALFFVHSLFASIQDTSVDAMAISVTPEPERGRVNAFMRAGFLLGGSLGAAGLAPVLQQHGFQRAALLQSLALLFFTGLTFVIRLHRTDRLLPGWARARPVPVALAAPDDADNPPLRWIFRELFRNVSQPRNLQIFVCIWAVYLSFAVFFGSFIYTLIHSLHWAAKDVSVLEGSWANLVVLAALVGGGLLSDRLGPARLQGWVLGFIVLVIVGISAAGAQWGHPPVATGGILLASLVDPFMSVAALPLLMNLCDSRVAGSQFTTYMALINFGDVIGAKITGILLGFATAPVIGLCCAAVVLVALWRLRRVNAKARPTLQPQAAYRISK
ncbi:MFS transporter [Hymenobacter sp.]|uniref:MFS transporter n=1 Tax=Hymenobacter sp. TaxID=1898978 RepID=UPI00286BA56E|nr:MFS transporter [Hymenobacter sp.]